MQQFVKNVCTKFKVDRLSCFRTGSRKVFASQKSFPGEIAVHIKAATPNSL